MDTLSATLCDPGKSGVYHLTHDVRRLTEAAQAGGLACFRVDVGRAHDKEDFLELVSEAMGFPDWFGHNWDALADCLKDLSWQPSRGWVLVLERSKHFCSGHGEEFAQAMQLMAEIAEYWRPQEKPFWTLVGGPEGWISGYPPIPG